MKQDFQGLITGDIAGRDVINQIHHDTGRPLTRQERIELNDKVKVLFSDYGEHGADTWRFLHRTIGVESVDAMCIVHRDSAHAILDLLLDRAKLRRGSANDEANAGDMASLVLQVSDLTAKLRNSHEARLRSDKSRDDAYNQTGKMKWSLDSANSALAKNEKALANSIAQHCQVRSEKQQIVKKANRLLALSVMLGFLAVGAASIAYQQFHRATSAEAWKGICVFEGKAYAPGSVIDGKVDLLCNRGDTGVSSWQFSSTKNRRPMRPLDGKN